jgi:long-chain acyl-CoA synthetase
LAFRNLPEMFFAQAERLGPQPRYRAHRNGRWVEVTWAACAERVRALAAGLLALGVQRGDRVAILSTTRAEWMEIDLAILAVGGITIPIYPSSLAHECGYILWNSGATIVVVENDQQREKIEAVGQRGFELDGVPHRVVVRSIIQIDASGGVLSMDDLAATGRAEQAAHRAETARRSAAIGRDDLATFVYTSGTTGPPKGVMQTHGNHLASVEAIAALGFAQPGDVDFAFLPLAHSFQRLVEYFGLYAGTTTTFARSIDTVIDDLREARPHFMPAVPRIFEKMYTRIQSNRTQATGLQRRIADWAFDVGARVSHAQRTGVPLSTRLAVERAVAHRLVFSKIHDLLGGRVKCLISGGAPLSREIAEFFHGAGVLILEGYGLTETTPVLTCNRPDRYKLGTVGLPLSCVTLQLAADGEILAKGPNVAQGYYKRDDATREAWDAEGWFHTGDIGEFDADGFLRITDRKKDLIKTSGGKYVAPQIIENMLKTQPHVSQAVVIGDNRKYCVALLTLDAEELAKWAAAERIALPPREQWTQDARLNALMKAEVDAVNAQLAAYEQLKYFRILPHDFSPETGELTPSLKVKRKVITARFAPLIEAMYAT